MRHEHGLLTTWVIMGRNVWRARELIWQLFKRDFTAGYKKSFLGLSWLVIAPVLGIVSWVFLQKTGIMNPGDVGVPYPVFILVGTSMWGLFMGFFQGGRNTLSAGQALVMQVSYPHEALLFQQTAQQLAHFGITLAVNLTVMACFGVFPSWGVFALPLVMIPLLLIATALGLVASMISIVAMDINRIIELGLGFLLYLTPIIYVRDRLPFPSLQKLLDWNPLTHLVCSCRDILLYGRLYDLQGFCVSALAALVLFMMSWRLFYVSENKIIERMI